MRDNLIGVKSSHIFPVLYSTLRERVGGERGSGRELDVSCGVRELTEWAAQRGLTNGGEGNMRLPHRQARPKYSRELEMQRRGLNVTQLNCSVRAGSLFSPETHSTELLYTGRK